LDDAENLKALEANEQDNFWRVIYIFPTLINCLMLLSFYFFIDSEPIMFSISQNNDVEALKLIDRIYDKDEDR